MNISIQKKSFDSYMDSLKNLLFSPIPLKTKSRHQYEDEQHHYIETPMHGWSQDHINIEIEGQSLIIEGEKNNPFTGIEIISKSFWLPVNLNIKKITAKVSDGILSLIIPKATKNEI